MRSFSNRKLSLALTALALSGTIAHAAPIIEITPGLWAAESESWVNGQSVTAAMAKLRPKSAAQQQSCLTPQQARVDVPTYLESSLNSSGGPWQCEVKPEKADATSLLGTFACRTSGGGKAQGKLSATYGPTQFKLELNGRTNAVNGQTGEALGGTEVDIKHVSTGRRVGAC